MHIYTYECVECGDEFDVEGEEDRGFTPGHYVFCDFCEKPQLFLPVEHIEIQSVGIIVQTEQ